MSGKKAQWSSELKEPKRSLAEIQRKFKVNMESIKNEANVSWNK